MPLTRANIETILIRRCGRMLIAATLDGTTIDGSNPDLSDPLASALRACGLTVADVTSVADSDITALAERDISKLLDVAELRTLESCLGNLDLVDVREGPEMQALGQLGTRLETLIARKSRQVEKMYGIGLAALTSGLIDLGYQQQDLS